MFCAQCGVANPDNGSFCVGCGTPLRTQATSPGLVSGGPPVSASPPEKSGKAIASLICGLLFFVFPAAVAAVILGHLSLSEINKSAGRLTGRGMAITGLILGYLGAVGLGLIAVILVIAAIAIPNLLRARMAANEATAVGSMRTIETATVAYYSTYGNGFPPGMMVMDGVGTGSANCDHAQLIDRALASGYKAGYRIDYVPIPSFTEKAAASGCSIAGVATFEVHADPITRGTTGQRSYFTDQTGVIRYETDGPASVDSPPLE